MADPLRVLVAGLLNSPHVSAWADAVASTGNDVYLAGRDAPGLPPSRRGANVYLLPSNGPPLVRSLRMSRALAEVAAAVQPDLIHAHWLPEHGWMAAREGLRPLVCSAWGSDVFGIRGIGRLRSKRALDASALVLADSADLARATRALARREVTVEVVRWGLDVDRFSPGEPVAAREALGLDHDGPLVVSMRGLRRVYNPELQLEAFARLRIGSPDARLLLKHPTDSVPPRVKAAIKRLGLDDVVTVLGNVPPEQMPDVYRAADVVISVASTDSSPRGVWEALACARPVIVSDLPWARDELASGRQALLVPLDARAIADAMQRVLGDESFARSLGHEAHALAVTELDPERCAARIDALYRSVLDRPDGRGR